MAKSIKFKDDVYLNSSSITLHPSAFKPLTLNEVFCTSTGTIYPREKGWYRIAKIFQFSGAHYDYNPECIIVMIGTDWSWFNGQSTTFIINKGGSATAASILNQAKGSTVITEARVVFEGSATYLEIYWNSITSDGNNNSNHFFYSIFSFNGGVTLISPTLVGESTGTIRCSITF